MPTEPQQPLHPDLLPAAAPITPAGSNVTVHVQRRDLTMHQVFDHELANLQDASPSLPLTFFGLTFGAAVAFGITVLAQSASDKGHATFIALFWGAVVLSLYFAFRSYQAKRTSDRIVADIRQKPLAQRGGP